MQRTTIVAMTAVLMLVLAGPLAAQCPSWDTTTFATGFDETVRDARVYPTGPGQTELAVGGTFATAGGVAAARIASWDGSTWNQLGAGFSASVNTLAGYDSGSGEQLYAGGFFTQSGATTVQGLARFDGSLWQPVGFNGVDGRVYAMQPHDDGSGNQLYVAGKFATVPTSGATNISAPGIARWNGSTWSAVGGGIGAAGEIVHALAEFDDGNGLALYAAGDFTVTGVGGSANRIAKWDGTSWTALGSGLDAEVFALVVFDDGNGAALYAGGIFTQAGGSSAASIAKWDGTSWSALAGGDLIGPQPYVLDLEVFDDGSGAALYVAGGFRTAGMATVNQIAKWDGTNWAALDGGSDGGPPPYIHALAPFDGGMLAGGDYTSIDGTNIDRVAIWRGCP